MSPSVTVRLQPESANPDDPTEDIASRTLSSEFVDLENGTEFLLPEFSTENVGSTKIIVETEGSE